MKRRQLKKLCKKAAPLIDTKCQVGEDDNHGLWGFWYECSYEHNEYEWCDAWAWLEDLFFDEHTEYSETGMEYAGPKPTTINKLRWAAARAT